ncbi:MAG: endonuclease [Blastococcus sp.]|nr:endonuclease [Blastococcus sp.]
MRELLQSLLDALNHGPLDSMVTAGQVLDRTALLVTVRNGLDAELTRTVRKAENMQAPERDGLKSMRSWLQGHARLSAREAHRLVVNGRALEQLPAVAAAFSAGAVTADQLAVVAPVAAVDVQAEAVGQGVDLAVIDVTLAGVATTHVHAELGKVVQHFLSRLRPDGTEPDPTEGRLLSIARHPDGSRSFRGELDAVGGEKLEAWLEALLQANRPAGDTRTRAQQLADALVQGVDNALAAGQAPILRTVKPHVIVRVDLDDLIDPAGGPGSAQTWFGAQISAARARWLACDGNVSRVVFGPDGHTLDLGRTHRVVPHHLRKAVELRDERCVFAGCAAPSYWCDVHHLVHWIDGGETDLENSALLCERHHTKVHHGFRVERQSDGRWHTYRPDDTQIVLREPLALAG